MKAEEIELGKTYLRGDGVVMQVVSIEDLGAGAIVKTRARPQDQPADLWPWNLTGPIGPLADSLTEEVDVDWLHPETAAQLAAEAKERAQEQAAREQEERQRQEQEAAEAKARQEEREAAQAAQQQAAAEAQRQRDEAEAQRRQQAAAELVAAEDEVARLQSELILAQTRLHRAQRG